MQCIAHGRSAVVALAVARAGAERQRNLAADPGISRADDRRATQRGFDRRPCAAEGGNDPLQPGSYRDHGRRPAPGDDLRMLPFGQGEVRRMAEAAELTFCDKIPNKTLPNESGLKRAHIICTIARIAAEPAQEDARIYRVSLPTQPVRVMLYVR